MFLSISVKFLFLFFIRVWGIVLDFCFFFFVFGFWCNFELGICLCFRFVIIRSTMDVVEDFSTESCGFPQLECYVDKFSKDHGVL